VVTPSVLILLPSPNHGQTDEAWRRGRRFPTANRPFDNGFPQIDNDLHSEIGATSDASHPPRIARWSPQLTDFSHVQQARREKILWCILGGLWLVVFAYRFFGLTEHWQNIEQMYDGLLARGLVDGLLFSPWYYQYHPQEHGPLIFGIILWPFFYFGGSRLLWLKLLGACFAAAGVGFWTAAVRRAWGLWPAVLFFLFCLAPPPFLESHFHLVYANHMESMALMGVLVWAFARSAHQPPSFRQIAALGLFAGFATFFCWQNLLMTGAVAVAALWRWRGKVAPRLLQAGAPAFLLGLAPHWLAPGHVSPLTQGGLEKFQPFDCWGKLFGVVMRDLARYEEPAVSIAWAAFAGVCLVWTIAKEAPFFARRGAERKKPDWLGRLLFLYVLFFIAVLPLNEYVRFNNNTVHDRYLVPAVVAALACIAGLAARMPGIWKLLPLAPFLFFGFANIASRFPPPAGYFQYGWKYHWLARGDNYRWLVRSALPRSWNGDLTQAPASIDRLPPPWRNEGAVALGYVAGPQAIVDKLTKNPTWMEERQTSVARGAGEASGCGYRDPTAGSAEKTARQCEKWLDKLNQLDPRLAVNFLDGAGFGLMEPFQVQYLYDVETTFDRRETERRETALVRDARTAALANPAVAALPDTYGYFLRRRWESLTPPRFRPAASDWEAANSGPPTALEPAYWETVRQSATHIEGVRRDRRQWRAEAETYFVERAAGRLPDAYSYFLQRRLEMLAPPRNPWETANFDAVAPSDFALLETAQRMVFGRSDDEEEIRRWRKSPLALVLQRAAGQEPGAYYFFLRGIGRWIGVNQQFHKLRTQMLPFFGVLFGLEPTGEAQDALNQGYAEGEFEYYLGNFHGYPLHPPLFDYLQTQNELERRYLSPGAAAMAPEFTIRDERR